MKCPRASIKMTKMSLLNAQVLIVDNFEMDHCELKNNIGEIYVENQLHLIHSHFYPKLLRCNDFILEDDSHVVSEKNMDVAQKIIVSFFSHLQCFQNINTPVLNVSINSKIICEGDLELSQALIQNSKSDVKVKGLTTCPMICVDNYSECLLEGGMICISSQGRGIQCTNHSRFTALSGGECSLHPEEGVFVSQNSMVTLVSYSHLAPFQVCGNGKTAGIVATNQSVVNLSNVSSLKTDNVGYGIKLSLDSKVMARMTHVVPPLKGTLGEVQLGIQPVSQTWTELSTFDEGINTDKNIPFSGNLIVASSPGSFQVTLSSVSSLGLLSNLSPGDVVTLQSSSSVMETHTLDSIDQNILTFKEPLTNALDVGTLVKAKKTAHFCSAMITLFLF